MKAHYLLLLTILLYNCSDSLRSIDPSADAFYAYKSNSLSYYDNATGDQYNEIIENPFINVNDEPFSTFSIDADGGSYSNVRRFINEGMKPPADAIRTEELVNYFQLDYPDNSSEHPLSLNGEVATCPWAEGHKLIRIGIKGKELPENEMPPSNFVLLIDVSGSMSSDDKLDLLKEGFMNLVDEFSEQDRIAIVTYAGNAGLVLPSTSGNEKLTIKNAIASLGSGGSTAGAEGIVTAYEIAEQNLIENGNNRVILGTDGDFNVGPSSQDELIDIIESKRDRGIYLTVLGVGRGNLNEGALEQIANKGNGTYEYIDNLEQSNKVFIYEYSKFFTVAKDVKVQVEFNSINVLAYRLIGYENRLLENEDFEDDAKDAGELGAGQNVTALYEIIPANNPAIREIPTFTIQFRYKIPNNMPQSENESIPVNLEIFDEGTSFLNATENMIFTASVAGYGLLLRDSEYKGDLTFDKVYDWSNRSFSFDPYGFKEEFKSLIQKAAVLK